MDSKRTKQIAVRITPETYEVLEKEAAKLKWSIAQIANEILSKWTQEKEENGGAINFIITNNQNININGRNQE